MRVCSTSPHVFYRSGEAYGGVPEGVLWGDALEIWGRWSYVTGNQSQSFGHIAGHESDSFSVRVGLRQGRQNFWAQQSVGGSQIQWPLDSISIFFPDDVVLLASCCFADVCEAVRMKISNITSETMVLSWKRID